MLTVLLALFAALVMLAMVVYLVPARGSAYLPAEYRTVSTMTSANNGIIDTLSSHSVDQTVANLKRLLEDKGVRLFAVIDHSGEAEKVGKKMLPTNLLIFGNPTAGTPIMLAAPRAALDLPLKVLIWEDGQGKVWLSYDSPEYLQERHNLPDEVIQNIALVGNLASEAAK